MSTDLFDREVTSRTPAQACVTAAIIGYVGALDLSAALPGGDGFEPLGVDAA